MLDVRNAVADILDNTSLAQLRGPAGAAMLGDDQLTA